MVEICEVTQESWGEGVPQPPSSSKTVSTGLQEAVPGPLPRFPHRSSGPALWDACVEQRRGSPGLWGLGSGLNKVPRTAPGHRKHFLPGRTVFSIYESNACSFWTASAQNTTREADTSRPRASSPRPHAAPRASSLPRSYTRKSRVGRYTLLAVCPVTSVAPVHLLRHRACLHPPSWPMALPAVAHRKPRARGPWTPLSVPSDCLLTANPRNWLLGAKGTCPLQTCNVHGPHASHRAN